MIYSVKFDALVTGSTANTYKTLIALIMPNTAGCIGRLRKVVMGPGGAAPEDLSVDIKIGITDSGGAGTPGSTPNVNTIQSHEQDQRASVVSGLGINYSGEPSTFQTGAGGFSMNSRATFSQEWPEGKGPKWGKNQTLCIKGAPGTSAAVHLSGTIEWEE